LSLRYTNCFSKHFVCDKTIVIKCNVFCCIHINKPIIVSYF
jgi:hypothetical protein